MNNDTPRTNRVAGLDPLGLMVNAEFARQLERDWNTACDLVGGGGATRREQLRAISKRDRGVQTAEQKRLPKISP